MARIRTTHQARVIRTVIKLARAEKLAVWSGDYLADLRADAATRAYIKSLSPYYSSLADIVWARTFVRAERV